MAQETFYLQILHVIKKSTPSLEWVQAFQCFMCAQTFQRCCWVAVWGIGYFCWSFWYPCIPFALLLIFAPISVSGLPGGGSGPVEVQVLLPVRILQEVQGSAARSVNLPGYRKGVLTMVETFKVWTSNIFCHFSGGPNLPAHHSHTIRGSHHRYCNRWQRKIMYFDEITTYW